MSTNGITSSTGTGSSTSSGSSSPVKRALSKVFYEPIDYLSQPLISNDRKVSLGRGMYGHTALCHSFDSILSSALLWCTDMTDTYTHMHTHTILLSLLLLLLLSLPVSLCVYVCLSVTILCRTKMLALYINDYVTDIHRIRKHHDLVRSIRYCTLAGIVSTSNTSNVRTYRTHNNRELHRRVLPVRNLRQYTRAKSMAVGISDMQYHHINCHAGHSSLGINS